MPNDSKAQRVEYRQTEFGLVPVYADQIIEQPYEYTDEDHDVWVRLLERQLPLVRTNAHSRFLAQLDKMPFTDKIPKFSDLNEFLHPWELVAVNGLLSDVAFFDLLSRKKFPVTWWIRKPHQIEYIQEPDLFHDLFGHVALLMDEEYSSLVQEFGIAGSGNLSSDPKFMEKLARMYWFSVEFGLMKDGNDIKAIGAGLMSSPGEIIHALDEKTEKKPFRYRTVGKTSYKIDNYQMLYFYCDHFKEITSSLREFQQNYDSKNPW